MTALLKYEWKSSLKSLIIWTLSVGIMGFVCILLFKSMESNMADMAESFLKCGVRHVIIKLGGRGCYILSKDIREHIPAVPETRCVDTTGAGDSFAGGFLCALSEGKDFRECAVFAGACGSAAVESVGATAGIVSRAQIEERVHFYCGNKGSFVL